MTQKELPTRQFRKKPFCWQEKEILRLLRRRYNKRTLPYRRAIYVALTEIESDFGTDFIKNYTKTVATYAGVNRHLASRILREFVELGIISIEIFKDDKGRFAGRRIELLQCPVAEKPPVDEPPVVITPHKKVVIRQKVISFQEGRNDQLRQLYDEKRKLVESKSISSSQFAALRTAAQEETAREERRSYRQQSRPCPKMSF